jgi:thioredoxin 1
MAFSVLSNSSDLKNIIRDNKNVVIQFSASWCGPCKMIKPFMEEIGNKNNEINVIYIDIDSHQNLSSEYSIRGVPMFAFYQNGIEFGNRITGADKSSIQERITSMFKT